MLAKGVPVRALVRKPEAARLPRSAEIACGDLTHPETLDKCLDGIDTVFLDWVAPGDAAGRGYRADREERAADRSPLGAAQNSTSTVPAAEPFPHAGELVERVIETSGLQWTFLRPGMFRIEEVSPEQWRRELPVPMPSSVAKFLLDARAAAIGQSAFVTSTVAELLGSPPRTFREWATDHVAHFRA